MIERSDYTRTLRLAKVLEHVCRLSEPHATFWYRNNNHNAFLNSCPWSDCVAKRGVAAAVNTVFLRLDRLQAENFESSARSPRHGRLVQCRLAAVAEILISQDSIVHRRELLSTSYIPFSTQSSGAPPEN